MPGTSIPAARSSRRSVCRLRNKAFSVAGSERFVRPRAAKHRESDTFCSSPLPRRKSCNTDTASDKTGYESKGGESMLGRFLRAEAGVRANGQLRKTRLGRWLMRQQTSEPRSQKAERNANDAGILQRK